MLGKILLIIYIFDVTQAALGSKFIAYNGHNHFFQLTKP